jgi:TonB family protein
MKQLLTSLVFFAAATAALAQAPGGEFQSAKIFETTPPVFPESLISSHRSGGTARVVLDVSRDGRLADWLVIGYTNRLFADAAVAALREWTFEPARWNGEPVSVCLTLTFNFEVKGVVISIMAADTVESLFPWMTAREIYRPCTLRDLDRIPVPLHSVAPVFPRQLADTLQPCDVTVEFFIDEKGAVRMAHVVGRPPRILAGLALEAIDQWKFEAPTSRGRPVLVCVQQLFHFVPAPNETPRS